MEETHDSKKAVLRPDGRRPDQLRALECEQGLLHRADGSARVNQGNTSVIVAVYGPITAQKRTEDSERAIIDLQFKSAAGASTNFETEKAEILKKTIESVIMRTLHPLKKITVAVQVVNANGSLLAVSVNATLMALMNAGIPCSSMCAAVCMCVSASSQKLLLDPTASEEAEADNVETFVLSSSGGLLATETRGITDEESYMVRLNQAREASNVVLSFLKVALKTDLNLSLRTNQAPASSKPTKNDTQPMQTE